MGITMKREDIEACVAAGFCKADTAVLLGVYPSTVSRAAKKFGIEFKDGRHEKSSETMKRLHADPEFAKANSERMRELNKNPEFRAASARRIRFQNRCRDAVITCLTDAQLSDYKVLRRAGYKRNEALQAMKVIK